MRQRASSACCTACPRTLQIVQVQHRGLRETSALDLATIDVLVKVGAWAVHACAARLCMAVHGWFVPNWLRLFVTGAMCCCCRVTLS